MNLFNQLLFLPFPNETEIKQMEEEWKYCREEDSLTGTLDSQVTVPQALN